MPKLRPILRLAALGIGICLTIALVNEAWSVLVGRNFNVVIANRVYRSAQPTKAALHKDVADYGIKTVVNLRGCSPFKQWYQEESQATAELDVAQEDVTLSAGRLPDPFEIRRLVEILDRSEFPILLHCQRGVDRTGLTSAIVQILCDNASINEARRQLSCRFGHFPWGRTSAMLRFLSLYERWLTRTDAIHSPDKFRKFATQEYCPGPARGRIEKIEEPQLVAGKAGVVRLRATNLSDQPWRLKAGTSIGIHLKYQVCDATGAQLQCGQAGLFAATVRPGEGIVLTLPINRLPRAGRYVLHADLLDGPLTGFNQVGGDIFAMEFAAK